MRPRWWDGVACGLAALALYALFAQESFYHTDGVFIVKRQLAGEIIHNNHFAYMPLLFGLQRLLEPLGLAPYRIALLLSALGTAVAVVLAHATCRSLGADRRRAFAVTATFAVCAPVFFFATVIEFHGPFLAFAQLAFLAQVAFAARPGLLRALVAAIAIAAAFTAHTSAVLLPGLLAPWFVAQRLHAGRTAGWGWAAAGAALALAMIWAALAGLQACGFPEFPPAYDRGRLDELSLASLARLPGLAGREWWWPFVPFSLVLPFGLFHRATRGRTLALACGFAVFSALCLTLLVDPPRPERGAYLLPLAFPAIVLTLELVGALPVFVLAAIAGCWGVIDHDRKGAEYDAIARGASEVLERDCMLWIADEVDLAVCLTRLPGVDYLLLAELAVLPPADVEPQLHGLGAFVSAMRAQGRSVYLTARAEAYLRDPAVRRWGALMPSGPLLVESLREQFRWIEVGGPGFAAYRLEPR